MTRILFSLLLLLGLFRLQAQSPHGNELKLNCAECHDPSGWTVDLQKVPFDHSTTDFDLEGAHARTDCKLCHSTLVFSEAAQECISCHTDMHSMSVGNDCARCHTSQSWLVNNMTEIHEENGFPLIGAHGNLNCVECHLAETNLRFDRIGNECVNCHLDNYQQTQHPNHQQANYSTDCIDCHNPLAHGWNADVVTHDFFPLTRGHDIADCAQCHTTGNFADANPECVSCHLTDRNQAINPNHQALNLSTDCATCHSTEPDWMPARFDNHDDYYALNGAHAGIANDCAACHHGDYNNTPTTCVGCHQDDYANTSNPNHTQAQFSTDCATCHTETAWEPATLDHDGQYFPIYSGTHAGEWTDCVDCHTNPNNYAEVSCLTCHTNPQTNNDHNGVAGYAYQTSACLACHPTGSATEGFDHNATAFPLTQSHVGVACIECHANGYAGTPTDCYACHADDYAASANPNHTTLGLSTDCATCHTAAPDWEPATFAVHDNYHPLNGAHAAVATNCAVCHNGDYNNTPNTCVGCHLADYTSTSNPNHSTAQFPTDCASCHNESDWTPATFDHDGMYFPIYSGKHNNKWDNCIECHANPGNYADFTCLTCHKNPGTNNDHNGVNGYVYQSTACLQCHPNGN